MGSDVFTDDSTAPLADSPALGTVPPRAVTGALEEAPLPPIVEGTIADEEGHELPYVFKPARDPSAARILVILHGHGANKVPAQFVSGDWNVLCPLDRYGDGGLGSWWLGENGDFFVARLLHRLVRQIRAELGGDRGLYFWGSSMGGYGALLHGTLLRAYAVYAHIPQIRLRGTSYTDGPNKRFYDAVLGQVDQHPWLDLAKFIGKRPPAQTPTYFINQNRFDYKHYLEQHCLYFVAACNRAGLAYSLNIDPITGHRNYRNIAEGTQLFDRFTREIRRWRLQPAETSTPRPPHAVAQA